MALRSAGPRRPHETHPNRPDDAASDTRPAGATMMTVRDIGARHPYAQGIITSDAQAYLMSDSAPPFTLDITIDRSSKTPLHTQISEPLASLILDGTLPAGLTQIGRASCRERV